MPASLRCCIWLSGLGFQDLNIWRPGPRTWVSGLRYLAPRSQDLGFKTSINGHWVWLSGPGFQDLDRRTDIGHRKLSILRSSYLFPVTFLCVHRHFSLRPVVGVMAAGSRWSVISMAGFAIENAPRTSSDERTHAQTSDWIYMIGVRRKISLLTNNYCPCTLLFTKYLMDNG